MALTLLLLFTATLGAQEPPVTVFTGVSLLTMDVADNAVQHDRAVIVRDEEITWIGPASEFAPPTDAVQIDGSEIGDAGARTVTLVERAQEFRSLLSTGAYDSARTMMSPNARRWFAPRVGEGLPWIIGETAGGAWARWDEHFGSEGEVVEWAEDDSSATAIVRETNDYYRLLERGPQLNRLTYHFDSDGLIEGLVIGSAGERDMGLTQQFQAWARENRPEEIAELMPGGDIDPSYPERFRRLLNEWRQATGRLPLE